MTRYMIDSLEMTDEEVDKFIQECHEMNDEEWKAYKKCCSEK